MIQHNPALTLEQKMSNTLIFTLDTYRYNTLRKACIEASKGNLCWQGKGRKVDWSEIMISVINAYIPLSTNELSELKRYFETLLSKQTSRDNFSEAARNHSGSGSHDVRKIEIIAKILLPIMLCYSIIIDSQRITHNTNFTNSGIKANDSFGLHNV